MIQLHRNVSNSQVYSNDEFDLWPVYSGERFRAFRPSCYSKVRYGKMLEHKVSWKVRSGGSVVDNKLDYQSRDRKIDPSLLRSFG